MHGLRRYTTNTMDTLSQDDRERGSVGLAVTVNEQVVITQLQCNLFLIRRKFTVYYTAYKLYNGLAQVQFGRYRAAYMLTQ